MLDKRFSLRACPKAAIHTPFDELKSLAMSISSPKSLRIFPIALKVTLAFLLCAIALVWLWSEVNQILEDEYWKLYGFLKISNCIKREGATS